MDSIVLISVIGLVFALIVLWLANDIRKRQVNIYILQHSMFEEMQKQTQLLRGLTVK